jgi:hypothetical protein
MQPFASVLHVEKLVLVAQNVVPAAFMHSAAGVLQVHAAEPGAPVQLECVPQAAAPPQTVQPFEAVTHV